MPEVMQLMLIVVSNWTVAKRESCCVVDDKHEGETNVAAVAVMVDWFLISGSNSDSNNIIAGKSTPTARLPVQMVPLQDT
jgi:hypothetical protein